MSIISLFCLVALLHVASSTFAVQNRLCASMISTSIPIRKNVVVPPGATCRIRSTAVFGNIIVRDGGTLITAGRVWIAGTIKAFPHATIRVLGRSQVMGMINIVDARLATGRRSFARTIIAKNSQITHKGLTRNIESTGSTSLKIMGGRVLKRGIRLGHGNCNLTLSSAIIKGGITLNKCSTTNTEAYKRIIFTAHRSRISGLIKLNGGIGEMFVARSKIYGGIFSNATGGSLDIQKSVTGPIRANKISNLFVRSSIIRGTVRSKYITDDVHLTDSRFVRPAKVWFYDTDNNVIIKRNHFTGSTLTVERARLSMQVDKNKRFSARIIQNGMPFGGTARLVFTRNVVWKAMFVKNFPVLNITTNAFKVLSCAGNAKVTGSGNRIAVTDGSCFA